LHISLKHPNKSYHLTLNLFSKIASSLAILMHLFLVATNLDAVLFILPFVIYTLHAYFTYFDTYMIGFWFLCFRQDAEGCGLNIEGGVVKVYEFYMMEEFILFNYLFAENL
jgi:hypothetical protein